MRLYRYWPAVFAVEMICSLAFTMSASAANALRIEVVTACNLVVGANITSPATKAPCAACLGGDIWNVGTSLATNVYPYTGNDTIHTPGIDPNHAPAPLVGPLSGGQFTLKQIGGSASLPDASRDAID